MQAPNTINVDQAVIDFVKRQSEQAKREEEVKKLREKEFLSKPYNPRPF